VTAGAAMVLNGHDHDHEWFAALDAAGTLSPMARRSSSQASSATRSARSAAHSVARLNGTPAVLFLALRFDGYSWVESTVDGRVVGSGAVTRRSLQH
jgi:hypothetical protein